MVQDNLQPGFIEVRPLGPLTRPLASAGVTGPRAGRSTLGLSFR